MTRSTPAHRQRYPKRPINLWRQDALTLARLLRAGGLGPDVAVTAGGRRDGVGSQAMTAVAAMVFARTVGCRFLHSPLRTVSHAIGDKGAWARRWEEFLNLGDGERPVPPDAMLVDVQRILAESQSFRAKPIVIHAPVFTLPSGTDMAAELTRHYASLRPALQERYRQAGKAGMPLHRKPGGGMMVAVHVRRGDVTRRQIGRYVSDDAVLEKIRRLRRAADDLRQPLDLHVYSEGSPEMFGEFAAAGCQLHLSVDPFETFHNLVSADVLVMAPSSFSRLAALLSAGIVIPVDDRRWNERDLYRDPASRKFTIAAQPASGALAALAAGLSKFWPDDGAERRATPLRRLRRSILDGLALRRLYKQTRG